MMKPSKHNIISKIHNSDEYFIVNNLSGNADILSVDEVSDLNASNPKNLETFIEKGYWINKQAETKLFRNKYLEFTDNREQEEIQIFFVLNYSCNFSCSYCYQSDYTTQNASASKDVITAFFDYINTEFKNRKKYITLFGGEPLLSNDKHKELVSFFVQQTKISDIEISIVTNGYNLTDYITILQQATVREIQLTLDGTVNIHNTRRKLKNNKPTFDKIVESIDATLSANIPVNLRMVIDKENINDLPDFAQFCIDKGWTKNSLFKTQLGRNYELHFCQSENKKLYSRIDLYKDIYDLVIQNPHIIKFHKPAFSISRFLFENGELPEPLFDACPGCKSEWAFDYTGNIYSCTATVGKDDEALGTFFPEITKKDNIIEDWEDRDIMSIPECKDCSLQLACGGGCASIAKNQHGNINSPDCRPIKELLELGISLYKSEK